MALYLTWQKQIVLGVSIVCDILYVSCNYKYNCSMFKTDCGQYARRYFSAVPFTIHSLSFFAAVPGKCQGPLETSDITKNSCHLSWKPPKDDGGSKIQHYQVEKREAGKPYWTTVATFCKEPNFDVQGLVEDHSYDFRVCAVNENGEGEYLQGDVPITAKMPFGRWQQKQHSRGEGIRLPGLAKCILPYLTLGFNHMAFNLV